MVLRTSILLVAAYLACGALSGCFDGCHIQGSCVQYRGAQGTTSFEGVWNSSKVLQTLSADGFKDPAIWSDAAYASNSSYQVRVVVLKFKNGTTDQVLDGLITVTILDEPAWLSEGRADSRGRNLWERQGYLAQGLADSLAGAGLSGMHPLSYEVNAATT